MGFKFRGDLVPSQSYAITGSVGHSMSVNATMAKGTTGIWLLLGGTDEHIELWYPFNPANARIQMSVYPISSGNGLPDNAPSVVAGQWNDLNWTEAYPELVYLGWDGVNFFNGYIRNVILTDTDSGDYVRFAVNSGATDVEEASIGGSYIPYLIFHNIVAGDWV